MDSKSANNDVWDAVTILEAEAVFVRSCPLAYHSREVTAASIYFTYRCESKAIRKSLFKTNAHNHLSLTKPSTLSSWALGALVS